MRRADTTASVRERGDAKDRPLSRPACTRLPLAVSLDGRTSDPRYPSPRRANPQSEPRGPTPAEGLDGSSVIDRKPFARCAEGADNAMERSPPVTVGRGHPGRLHPHRRDTAGRRESGARVAPPRPGAPKGLRRAPPRSSAAPCTPPAPGKAVAGGTSLVVNERRDHGRTTNGMVNSNSEIGPGVLPFGFAAPSKRVICTRSVPEAS